MKQVGAFRGQSPSVQATFGAQRVTLREGQRVSVKNANGVFALTLIANTQVDKAGPAFEGDAYHVSLLVYRLDP